ncbi:MAG: hypothetical protein ACRC1P_02145 [Cellulosilyticaceae bacterium]
MLKIIQAEWNALRRDKFMWGAVVVLTIIAVIGSVLRVGMIPEYIREQSTELSIRMSLSQGQWVFSKGISDSNFTILLVSPLVSILLGRDFVNRSMEKYILVGHSRLKIFMVKIIECYLIGCTLALIKPLVGCIIYSMPWFISEDTIEITYVLKELGVKILRDMALLGVAIVATFALKDFIRPVLVIFGFWFVVALFMMRMITSKPIGNIIYLEIITIIISVVISYLCFRKSELR